MAKIKLIPKEYVEIYKEVFNLINELKTSHEQGKYKTDNYYSKQYLRLSERADSLKIKDYEYEKRTKLHNEISFCIDVEMFSTFEAYEIEIPDPTGKYRKKYRWVTSEEELFQEVMKHYPKFKGLIEKMMLEE